MSTELTLARHRRLQFGVGLLVLCPVLGGCGADGKGLVTVTGQVLVDGKPLTTGMVTTTPKQGRGARGVIDTKGRFTLDSGDWGSGASIGAHAVSVIAVEQDPSAGLNPEAPKKLIIPERYTNPATSGLVIEVTPGKVNEVVLELSSK